MAELKGLLVDVGNVLIDERTWPTLDDRSYKEAALVRLANVFGSSQEWFDELFAVDQTMDGPGWVQGTHDSLAQRLAHHHLDPTPELVRRTCAALAVPLVGFVTPVIEARAALQAAQDLGLKLVVCSNTMVRSREDYVRDFRDFGLDHFFEAYLTSLDAGFRKPHPAIFEAGLTALGTRPEETAMIGDRPDRDIAGAKALGLRTIWVRQPEHVGPCQPTPDAEITNLAELAPILERWVQG